jgi:hypothetical protein
MNYSNTDFSRFVTDKRDTRLKIHDPCGSGTKRKLRESPNSPTIIISPSTSHASELEHKQEMAKLDKMHIDLNRLESAAEKIKADQEELRVKIKEASNILDMLRVKSGKNNYTYKNYDLDDPDELD